MRVEELAVGSISISSLKMKRTLSEEAVEEIAESIQVCGLIHPVLVREKEEGYELLAGLHRLEAVKRLGRETIAANIIEPQDDTEAELTALDENLRRAPEESAEFDEAVARWKELYEKKHGAAKPGRPRKNVAPRESFAGAVAKATGKSPKTIHRAVARNERLVPEVKKAHQESRITAGQADELVKLLPEGQRELLPEIIGKSRDETRARVTAWRKARGKKMAGPEKGGPHAAVSEPNVAGAQEGPLEQADSSENEASPGQDRIAQEVAPDYESRAIEAVHPEPGALLGHLAHPENEEHPEPETPFASSLVDEYFQEVITALAPLERALKACGENMPGMAVRGCIGLSELDRLARVAEELMALHARLSGEQVAVESGTPKQTLGNGNSEQAPESFH
jgi:ParB/RepB/Spo0J family partition protein